MSVGLKANPDGTSGAVQVNGSDVVYVNSSGNVGIGTSSPSQKLSVIGDVIATNNTNGALLGSSEGSLELFRSDSASYIDFKTSTSEDYDCRVQTLSNGLVVFTGGNGTAAERMRIDSAGNVGIGTTAPVVKFQVAGGDISISTATAYLSNIYWSGGWKYIGNGYGGGIKPAETDGSMTFLRAGNNTSGAGAAATVVESMRIDSAGNVGIGTSSPSYQLQLSLNSAAKPTSNVWTVASDERVKTVTGEYTKGLDAVCSLRPVTYKYNGKAGFVADGAENISIIAQEAREAFPECIGTFSAKLNETDEEETELLNWDGHALTFALVNAIKELRAQNEDLRARIAALEAV